MGLNIFGSKRLRLEDKKIARRNPAPWSFLHQLSHRMHGGMLVKAKETNLKEFLLPQIEHLEMIAQRILSKRPTTSPFY